MNIHKAPNLIIRPKCKVYRRGVGGEGQSTMNPFTHTHTHTHIHTHSNTHTHSLSHSHTYTHIHRHTHTHEYTHTHVHTHTVKVSGRECYWDEKRCLFRADLKTDVKLE